MKCAEIDGLNSKLTDMELLKTQNKELLNQYHQTMEDRNRLRTANAILEQAIFQVKEEKEKICDLENEDTKLSQALNN